MKKIVIVGSNHAGTAAANTIIDQYGKDHEVTMIDRNSNISYLGCGTPLWIGGQVDNPEGLFYSSKEQLEAKGINVYMETEVTDIDFNSKELYATTKDGHKIHQSYDKIILATGSLPISPKVKGIDLQNVFYVKSFQDAQKIHTALDSNNIKNVAVIGAGYIGVELAEAIQRRGKKALLFESAPTSLSGYYDSWFTHDMDRHLSENNIELHFEETLQEIKGEKKVSSLITNKGNYQVDMIIVSIGFVPNSVLGSDKLEKFSNGAYKVNLNQETNISDVYAAGDCATVYNNALEGPAYIALATNAVRSGIVAAHNACQTTLQSVGVQGSNGISIFGYNMVSTGLSFNAAKEAGFDVAYTDFEDLQKPAFMQTSNHPVKIRIVYDKTTRRILGAQIASFENISMVIHMFSLAVSEKVTIDKLKLLDIFFLPHFNQPYNYITMAALSAK